MKKYKKDINFFVTTSFLFLLMFTFVQIPSVSAAERELFMGPSFGTLTVDGVSISLNKYYADLTSTNRPLLLVHAIVATIAHDKLIEHIDVCVECKDHYTEYFFGSGLGTYKPDKK